MRSNKNFSFSKIKKHSMITLTSSNRKVASKNKNIFQISDIIFNINLKKRKKAIITGIIILSLKKIYLKFIKFILSF